MFCQQFCKIILVKFFFYIFSRQKQKKHGFSVLFLFQF